MPEKFQYTPNIFWKFKASEGFWDEFPNIRNLRFLKKRAYPDITVSNYENNLSVVEFISSYFLSPWVINLE